MASDQGNGWLTDPGFDSGTFRAGIRESVEVLYTRLRLGWREPRRLASHRSLQETTRNVTSHLNWQSIYRLKLARLGNWAAWVRCLETTWIATR